MIHKMKIARSRRKGEYFIHFEFANTMMELPGCSEASAYLQTTETTSNGYSMAWIFAQTFRWMQL